MRSDRWTALGLGTVVAGVIVVFGLRTHGQQGANTAGVLPSPAASLVGLNIKFQGAATCSNSDCHGAAAAKPNGYSFSNEYTLWSAAGNDADPHHNKTWAALRNAQGKQIAQGLGIADATKSDRCLSCHALSVPANVQGKNYKPNEGVTCNACHGPSDKYLDPHSKKGWWQQETSRSSFDQLLHTWGLYNTLPIHARAERCTSCHLAIEPDLVAKGHPQPTFELNYFSETYPSRHWHDKDGYFKAKLWVGGQQVALYEGLRQLASRANSTGKPLDDAYALAATHAAMMSHILSTADPADAATLGAAWQKVQAAYKSKQGLDAASMAAATVDGKLAGWTEAYNPDKAATLKLLNAIAGDTTIAPLGKAGQDQQSYAIFALFSAYSTAEKPANAEAVTNAIGDKLFPEKPAASPQAYLQNLAAVKAQLPK